MDPSPEQISALADQLSNLARAVAAAPDPMTRKLQSSNLVLQAKKTIWAIQEPIEAMMDQVVSTFSVAAALALMELGVFDIIPLQGTATVEKIAQESDAEEELIIRLMRQVTCVNICTEVSLHEWSHNRLSVALSEHHGVAGKHFFLVCMDEMLPPILNLNHYLRSHGARSLLHTYTHTPHSTYYNLPGHNFWEVLNTSPARINTFMSGLSMWSAMHPVIAMFPFATALAPGNQPDRVLAVDIGGGRGLAMLELRKTCPHLAGELILQDRPYVLDQIPDAELPGVTKMPHDFFLPQPVQGAQMYYIRRVMHDWQDADAVRILRNIVPAMAKDSRVIVSDMALPEPVTERDAGAVWLDVMMLSIGGKERTKRDWQLLGEKSGLVCKNVWMEEERYGPLCVVEYMLPEEEAVGEGMAESESEDALNGDGIDGTALRANGEGAKDTAKSEEAQNIEEAVNANGENEAEMGGTTPVMQPMNGAPTEPLPRNTIANTMNLDGAGDFDGHEQEHEQRERERERERDVDWEERTVVGDREQSVEPGQGEGA